jgi:hypothetical protein
VLTEPFAKRQFCNFNGVDRLRRNKASHWKRADGKMDGAEETRFAIVSIVCFFLLDANGEL